MTLALLIGAVLLSLIVSAICSLLEATLLSLTPGQVADLKRRRPKAGQVWERFKQDVERPISVILICNTAAHTIGATVAGAQFEELMEEWYGAGGWSVFVFGVVFTFLMLQFTEILPKTLGVRYNRTVAAITARPMAVLVRVMDPLVKGVKLLNRPFETRRQKEKPPVDVEEIVTLAALARTGEVIDEQQERMIRIAGKLGQIRVRQIMTPRKDVQFLRLGESFTDILRTLRNVPYTRLPVVERDLDHVRGMVHLKDVFNVLALTPGRFNVAPDPSKPDEVVAIPSDQPGGQLHVIGAGEVDLSSIVRPVPFVPETQPVDRLLKQFQTGESHMAIVVDEYGSVQGLVTLEDVIEELVGDIEDEFDEGEHVWQLLPIRAEGEADLAAAPVGWRCAGDVPVREIADRLHFDPGELTEGGVVTLGGYLTRELGRWPRQGDVVELAGWEVRVERVEGERVREATLIPLALADADDASE